MDEADREIVEGIAWQLRTLIARWNRKGRGRLRGRARRRRDLFEAALTDLNLGIEIGSVR